MSVSKRRTSISHPLQIAQVRAGEGMGLVGLTFCPGKQQPGAMSGHWDRDLGLDLDTVAQWNASAVVTLVEAHELASLKVAHMGEAVRERHMAWYHLAIRDVDVPDARFEESWRNIGARLRAQLRDGANVLVHCKGGLGRAGMIAGRLLAELGMAPQAAVEAVRAVRPGAIQTSAQLARVLATKAIPEPVPDPWPEAVRNRAMGALLGLALGDALGASLQGAQRDSVPRVDHLVGGGPFALAPGQWTAPTAMALALATSLGECRGFAGADFLERLAAWVSDGEFSCTGACLGLDAATARAVEQINGTCLPVAGVTAPAPPNSAALVRVAPLAIRYWQDAGALDAAATAQCRVSHDAPEAVDACRLAAQLLGEAIGGRPRAQLLAPRTGPWCAPVCAVATGSWRTRHRGEIVSSGDPAHLLEAALWCIGRTGSFMGAILLAANLGEEAAGAAALTGQLAGALYGADHLPPPITNVLAWCDLIESIALELTTPWGWYPE